MSDRLIVNVALTGCVAQKADNPNLPVTPQEMAEDARRCADEGATVFHVHARDARGNPAWGAEAYRECVDAVRAEVHGAVVCASTSGRHFRHFEERSAAILAGPDLASLTLGSVDFPGGGTSENGRATVRGLLKLMRHHGVRPECEAFDLGHVMRLRELELERPTYVNLILGVHLPVESNILHLLMKHLPPNATWGATGIGPDAWPIQGWSIVLGGHVRVGLEDSLWMGKGDPATNPRLVARAVAQARGVGREPATFAEAREMLGLAPWAS